MNDFPFFDTNDFSEMKDALDEGNKEFKKKYLEEKIIFYDIEEEKDGEIKFSPKSINTNKYLKAFAHTASRGEDEGGKKYDTHPCENDLFRCKRDCIDGFIGDYQEGDKKRMYCSYRLARIFIFYEMIKLYKNGDKRIHLVPSEDKTQNGSFRRRMKFIYIDSKEFYLAIIEKVKYGTGYRYYYVTCFPITSVKWKRKLKEECKNYKKREK